MLAYSTIVSSLLSTVSRLQTLASVLALAILMSGCGDGSNKDSRNTLRIGVTTTLEDSGLLEYLLAEFQKTQVINVKPIVTGSGRLFTLVENGDVDIAISHEAVGENTLKQQGIISARIPVFYNYFIVVGPKTNPAKVNPDGTITEAFTQIMNSGQPFVSRNDNSGTHKTEQAIWSTIKRSNVKGNKASSTTTINTGTGMGASLAVAIDKQAYTLVDIGTWARFNNKQQHQALWAIPHALPNSYHLLVVNTDRIHHTNANAAAQFQQWLLQPKTQRRIQQYRVNQQALFFIGKP